MPTGIGREETLRLRANRNKNSEGALVTKEDIMAATGVKKTKKKMVVAKKVEEPKPILYIHRSVSKLQDQKGLHEMYNEKNVWFMPHIQYFSLKNGPDFTFTEKIQLQNALDQIIKVSLIANWICLKGKLPFRIKKSNTMLRFENTKKILSINESFKTPNHFLTITDLRDPDNSYYINKSYPERLIMEQKMLRFSVFMFGKVIGPGGGDPVYLMSNFFRLGLTVEQRATILYCSFVESKYIVKGIDHSPMDTNDPAVLLFEDILATLKETDTDAKQIIAELENDKKHKEFEEHRMQAEILAAERLKGYTIFPAYDQETPSSETSKPKVMKKAIKRASSAQRGYSSKHLKIEPATNL